MSVLETRNVSKTYSGISVLRHVSLAFKGGSAHGIIGPNGSGKTTLLNIISGFASSDAGSVYFGGRSVDQLMPEQRWSLGLARSFQDNRLALRLTVAENLGLSVRSQIGQGAVSALLRWRAVSASKERIHRRVWSLLRDCGLAALADQATGTLSFGQQRVVGVLGCLASEPKFLLLDEPAAGLSPTLKQKVLSLLLSYIQKSGAGVIVVDHDLDFIERISNQISFMHLGEVIAAGTLSELRRNPEVMAAYLGGPISRARSECR